MIRPGLAALGAAVLAAAWLGPLPGLARHAFAAHMALHMSVVAVGAPLLALGLSGGRFDPVPWKPGVFHPVLAPVLELIVVWGWHAPALHDAARSHPGVMIVEQGTFLGASLLVWFSAYGGGPAERAHRAGAGMLGLLLTSMHMTLLGALVGLAPRTLYAHPASSIRGMTGLEDQQVGGAVMLLVGGAVYLAGGVGLALELLRREPTGASEAFS